MACVPARSPSHRLRLRRLTPDSSPSLAQGVALLAAALYVGFRLTQRRFSNLDSGGDDIRWPELQPDGLNNLTTLNPQGTRRTGGAGFAMEKDRDDDDDEDDDGELDRKGAGGMGGEWSVEGSPRIGAGVGTYGMGHNASEAAFFEGQGRHSPYDGVYGQPLQQGQHDGQTSYCASWRSSCSRWARLPRALRVFAQFHLAHTDARSHPQTTPTSLAATPPTRRSSPSRTPAPQSQQVPTPPPPSPPSTLPRTRTTPTRTAA